MIPISKLINYHQKRTKRETLFCLRAITDRPLLDCGIGPDLLKEGVKAWPWKELQDNYVSLVFEQGKKIKPSTMDSSKDPIDSESNELSQHNAA